MKSDETYVPALGYRWLTSLYDPVIGLTTRERTFKVRLLRQARLRPELDVLDLGCGTGTLAVWAKQLEPGVRVTGIDGDRDVLSIARRKVSRVGAEVELRHGLSYQLPFPDATFDRVLSSLVLHHLSPSQKTRTLAEVFRVLRAGGELHVADWGQPRSRAMRLLFYSIQLLDGFPNTSDHVAGLLPQYFRDAGFDEVSVRDELSTVYGTLALYSGRRPPVASMT